MAESQSVYCFLDTNALLHHQTFDEVEWPEIFHASRVTLVLAPAVLAELNQHKDDNSNEWRRKRTGTLVSKLKSFWGQKSSTQPIEVRPNVLLVDIANEPLVDWPALGLDPLVNDDRLIATIIKFQQQQSKDRVVLMSDDFLAQRKAASHQIEVVDPTNLIAPIERPTDELATIRRLERQVQELSSRIPKLCLSFWDQGSMTNTITRVVSTAHEESASELEIAQEVKQKQEKLEQIVARTPHTASGAEIEKFARKYKSYIADLEQALMLQRTKDFGLSVRLRFVLQNVGSAPATDLEMSLRFPKWSLVVGASDEFWGKVIIPDEPIPEWTRIRNPLDFGLSSVPLIWPRMSEPPEQPGPKGPLYNIRDRSIVWFTTPKLRHKDDWRLRPLTAFLPPDTSDGFEIAYSIHADNLLDKIEGRLSVTLKRAASE